jgi:hypothetical protein
VKGERVQWVRGLELEGLLARHLPLGTFMDPLSGIKAMKNEEFREVVQRFMADVPAAVMAGLEQLRSNQTSGLQEHINSKFALDGASVGRFATLNDFYKGPEGLIGTPNPKILPGMEAEHCRRGNHSTKFTSGNYNVTTTPAMEWEFVVKPQMEFEYPHTPRDKNLWPKGNDWKGSSGREAENLKVFVEHPKAKRAGLTEGEVIGLRLYTGPMFVLYNAVLRGFPEKDVKCLWDDNAGKENRYETTIFVIASGITKLSKVSPVPKDRRLYRGLGGMILPRQFWEHYPECQVTFSVVPVNGSDLKPKRDPSAVNAVVQQLNGSLCSYEDIQGDLSEKRSDFYAADMSTNYLRLQLASRSEEKTLNFARVVRKAKCDGDLILMSVAISSSKENFTETLEETFTEMVTKLCGIDCKVKVEEVADKPAEFRGGGACWVVRVLLKASSSHFLLCSRVSIVIFTLHCPDLGCIVHSFRFCIRIFSSQITFPYFPDSTLEQWNSA